MSDQEMSLDKSIQLFSIAENFDEYRERLGMVLTRCKTHEEINKAKAIINDKKNQLLETSPEFKSIIDQRIQDAKARSEMFDLDIEEQFNRTRFKTVDPDELERRRDDKLGCPNPKCEDHGKNRKNIMNDVPTCMRCWHKLVPKSEFKDYNRAYWRRFNKKKKKRARR